MEGNDGFKLIFTMKFSIPCTKYIDSFTRLLIGFLVVLNSWTLGSQTASWALKCPLETKIQHSSGILTLNQGKTFWTQVDNSSPAEIYEIDSNCNILRTVQLIGVTKTDWEDITTDYQGTIYLGDFGNNNNSRRDLKIYILRGIETNQKDSIQPTVIQFNYSNQTNFPPEAAYRNFDMEAMVWYRDSLHLFSKNRTDPFTGYTYHYKIPAIEGNYAIHPLDSFKTGDGPDVFFWITGAAMNLEDSSLVLLSHDRIWQFSGFEGSDFFKGSSRMINLPSYSQKEGICYAKENIWYLTDEYFPTLRIGGNLYEMKLEEVSLSEDIESIDFEIYPNPVHNILEVILPQAGNGKPDELLIYNTLGRLIFQTSVDKARIYLPVENLVSGIYFVKRISYRLNRSIIKRLIK